MLIRQTSLVFLEVLMSKQVILCMETNKQKRTDYVYIQCVLNHYFEKDQNIVQTPVFMGTKSRYNHQKVIKEIETNIKAFHGSSHVIYFIDMDHIASSPEDVKLLDDIIKYCEQKKYDLVLFNNDIEDVFWGESVKDGEKVQKATMFRSNKRINEVSTSSLCASNPSRHKSNILNILKKYWTRKDGDT